MRWSAEDEAVPVAAFARGAEREARRLARAGWSCGAAVVVEAASIAMRGWGLVAIVMIVVALVFVDMARGYLRASRRAELLCWRAGEPDVRGARRVAGGLELLVDGPALLLALDDRAAARAIDEVRDAALPQARIARGRRQALRRDQK